MPTLPARAPDVLRQLATDFAVTANFAFLAHRRAIPASAGLAGPRINIGGLDYVVTNPLTLCNAYVAVFTAALACPIPPLKANQQLEWLTSNEGKMAGWAECDRKTAVSRASLGYPTVAAALDSPHGHIAVCMPSPATDPTSAYVSAAGAHNFVNDKLERSFGAVLGAKCRFFTHN